MIFFFSNRNNTRSDYQFSTPMSGQSGAPPSSQLLQATAIPTIPVRIFISSGLIKKNKN
jgi:hypothetical protein